MFLLQAFKIMQFFDTDTKQGRDSLFFLMVSVSFFYWLGVVACTCNPATFEAQFRNSVGSIPVGGNNPSIGEWIV